ncbi:MAG: hypothetical protein OXH30_08210, partial [Chloroflexi bacterium]|nr:hypothetical protein [Chloroflexota bacterium]
VDGPRSDGAQKNLIASAIQRIEISGWASAAGLGVGQAAGSYYGRYLHLAGNYAWLGIEYRAWQQIPDKPLWLLFFRRDNDRLTYDELGSRLDHLTERLESRAGTVCVPIDQLAGGGDQERLGTVVEQLENIGRLIDQNGPTYKQDLSND